MCFLAADPNADVCGDSSTCSARRSPISESYIFRASMKAVITSQPCASWRLDVIVCGLKAPPRQVEGRRLHQLRQPQHTSAIFPGSSPQPSALCSRPSLPRQHGRRRPREPGTEPAQIPRGSAWERSWNGPAGPSSSGLVRVIDGGGRGWTGDGAPR